MKTRIVKFQFYIVFAVAAAILLSGYVQTEPSASAVSVGVTSTDIREVPNLIEGETTNAQSEKAGPMQLEPGTLPYFYVTRYAQGWLEKHEAQARAEIAGPMRLEPGTLPYFYVNLYGRGWLEKQAAQVPVVQK